MTTTTLKILALIFMTIDHIGEFLLVTPIFLRWIGRLAYPIFAFCCVQGFLHTRNQKKYLFRLYAAGILMAVVLCILNALFSNGLENQIKNNIFTTLFQFVLLMWVIENKSKRNVIRYILYQILMLAVIWGIVILWEYMDAPWWVENILIGIFHNLFYHEGTLFFSIVGLAFYIPYKIKKNGTLKQYNIMGTVFYIVVAAMFTMINYFDIYTRIFVRLRWFFGADNFIFVLYEKIMVILGVRAMELETFTSYTIRDMFQQEYQWMMIFAAPFFLLYNGKRGKGSKWFFYMYYITHIVILVLIRYHYCYA